MRGLFFLTLLIPAPVLADTILGTPTIAAVTIYPQGAQIIREVRLNHLISWPAGIVLHELLRPLLGRPRRSLVDFGLMTIP
jgi:hypothetical protein